MTSAAIRKIFAECGLIIVTGRAARRRFCRVVHDHSRSAHLAVGGVMTTVAIEKSVFRMAEISADDLRRRRNIISAAGLMTGETPAAGKAAGVSGRRMARETGLVRRLGIRNGKVDALPA